jgi:hypothetical protein
VDGGIGRFYFRRTPAPGANLPQLAEQVNIDRRLFASEDVRLASGEVGVDAVRTKESPSMAKKLSWADYDRMMRVVVRSTNAPPERSEES